MIVVVEGGAGGRGVTAYKNGAVRCFWSLVRQDAAVSLEPDLEQPTLTTSFLYKCFVFFPAYYYYYHYYYYHHHHHHYYYSIYSDNLLMLL